MSPKTLRSLFAAAALVATPFALAASGTLLRLQPEDGKTYRYVLTQQQTMNTELGPMGSQKVDNSVRMELSQKVTGRNDDGSTSFDFTYDRMVFDVSAGPTVMHFDSSETGAEGESGADDPTGGVLSSLVGRTFGLTMSDRNRVLGVTGFDALWDEMASQAPADPMARQMADAIKKSFGEDSMKQLMQSGGAVFPEKPVAPGDSWTEKVDASNPILGDFAVSSTYKLEQPEQKAGRDCVRLAVDMTMSFGGEIPMIESLREMFAAQGAEVSIDIEVGEMNGSGTMWVDRSTGMTVASDLDQKMVMKVNLAMSAPNAPEPMNMAMAIDMDQKILMELVP